MRKKMLMDRLEFKVLSLLAIALLGACETLPRDEKMTVSPTELVGSTSSELKDSMSVVEVTSLKSEPLKAQRAGQKKSTLASDVGDALVGVAVVSLMVATNSSDSLSGGSSEDKDVSQWTVKPSVYRFALHDSLENAGYLSKDSDDSKFILETNIDALDIKDINEPSGATREVTAKVSYQVVERKTKQVAIAFTLSSIAKAKGNRTNDQEYRAAEQACHKNIVAMLALLGKWKK